MLTERQQKICDKYRKEVNGKVRCNECPNVIDAEYYLCRAFMHYNRSTRKWEYDE